MDISKDISNKSKRRKELFRRRSKSVSYLGIDTDDFVALLAPIREYALVALDAVRVLVPQHVALPGQRLVALPATEVAAVPILAHRLRVLATENQLERKEKKADNLEYDRNHLKPDFSSRNASR